MIQNTAEWHEFRLQGLGSSDAPVIMGVSPWKTKLELYYEKVGIKLQASNDNWATQRGHDLEPKARAQFELLDGNEYPPTIAVHPVYNFLRASLDGYNEATKTILEIKCPGAEDHKTALAGKIPEKYVYQLEHQLMVTGAARVMYYSYDGTDGCVVEYKSNAELRAKLFDAEVAFWSNVMDKVPPKPTEADVVELTDQPSLDLFAKYRDITNQIRALESELCEVRLDIIDLHKDSESKLWCQGVTLSKQQRKGTIEYSKINELEKVDLEKYRKPPSTTYVLRVD